MRPVRPVEYRLEDRSAEHDEENEYDD